MTQTKKIDPGTMERWQNNGMNTDTIKAITNENYRFPLVSQATHRDRIGLLSTVPIDVDIEFVSNDIANRSFFGEYYFYFFCFLSFVFFVFCFLFSVCIIFIFNLFGFLFLLAQKYALLFYLVSNVFCEKMQT